MTTHRRVAAAALAGCAALGAALGSLVGAGPVAAEPVDPFVVPAPPPPVVTYPVAPVANGAAMTPRQLALPPADPAAAPPPAPVLSESGIPEIQNPQYGSGNNGGGIFGTLKDLWDQVKDPTFVPGEIMGGPGPVPGAPAAPAPAPADGPSPALPPGYYPLDGPPPPGYEFVTPGSPPPPPLP